MGYKDTCFLEKETIPPASYSSSPKFDQGGRNKGNHSSAPRHAIVMDTFQVLPFLCCSPQMVLWSAGTFPEAPSSLCSAFRDTIADTLVHWEDAQAELLQLNLKEFFCIYSLIFTTCGSAQ